MVRPSLLPSPALPVKGGACDDVDHAARRIIACSTSHLCLAKLEKVELQRLDVVFKAQRAHGTEQVVAVDGFPLFLQALVAGPACNSIYFFDKGATQAGSLAGDEAYELGHALLHRLRIQKVVLARLSEERIGRLPPWRPWLSWRSPATSSS